MYTGKKLIVFSLLLCSFFAVSQYSGAQSISINEVMASNSVTVADQDGDFGDWIELYNYGTEAVDMAGFGLSDNSEMPFRWTFPSLIIQPGEFLIVWASGKDKRPEAGYVNGIMREVFTGIPGSSITDLTNHSSYPDSPSQRHLLTTGFEAPTDIGDQYGQRMHGFIEAPASGDYFFWIASDDNGRLWLSTDDNPENIEEIANVPEWTNPGEWDKYPEQQSAPVTLEEGKRYYIQALMKEDGGGDNLSVGWRLPSGTTEAPIPNNRLFWNESELHTNFSINWEGEEVLLTNADSVIVDEIAPTIIPNGFSYGRYPDGTGELVYYVTPSPGETNPDGGHEVLPEIPDPPSFSETGGSFLEFFDLSILYNEGLEVYYTTNGSTPVAGESRLYTDPVSITGTMVVRALAHEPGGASSEVVSATYTRLNYNTNLVSSNLPLMIIHQFDTQISDGDRTAAYMTLIDTGEDDRARLSSDPVSQGRILINVRGSSSTMFPKKMFGFHLVKEDGSNRSEPLLGMPEEHNWILNGPYSDKTLMRNVIAYGLGNAMGRYSPRTRFIEVYLHDGSGPLAESHYHGVYVLTERIKVEEGRIEIADLDEDDNQEPEISGGYIIKKDRFNIGESGLHTQRGTNLAFDTPKESEITPQQKKWLEDYLTDFESALFGENSADPRQGYAKYIDPDSFIDHHLITELLKEIDGYRLSTFMYKDRGGKLIMGPLWDFNLSLGNANYNDGWNPTGWYYPVISENEYINGWYNQLFADPQFRARYEERWWQLRRGRFSDDSLRMRINQNASLLNEAQYRNFQKWRILSEQVWPNYYVGNSFANEVSWMRDWLMSRTKWMDSQFEKSKKLVHFWHFNDLDEVITEIPADHTMSSAMITYPGTGDGYLDRVDDGTLLNADLGSPAGSGLRVRNPSDSRELILSLPTSDYKDIVFRYMVKRTPNGAGKQTVYYRTNDVDGWTQINDTVDVSETYEQSRFDFTGIEGVDDNSQFSIRILFHGEEASEITGNNRFDNITLEGYSLFEEEEEEEVEQELMAYHHDARLYVENPYEGHVNIEVFNINGSLIGRFQTTGTGEYNFRFDPPPGIYLVRMINGDHILKKKIYIVQ